jgi:hypothetical protein
MISAVIWNHLRVIFPWFMFHLELQTKNKSFNWTCASNRADWLIEMSTLQKPPPAPAEDIIQ